MAALNPSKNRLAALAIIEAYNAMDVAKIVAHRAPAAIRYFVPKSMGLPSQNNVVFERTSRKLLSVRLPGHFLSAFTVDKAKLLQVFSNFKLTLHALIEDVEQKTIVLHLTAKGDTKAGIYENEYMWILEFDDDALVVKSTEFVDSVMQRDFWPRLQAAMDLEKAKAA